MKDEIVIKTGRKIASAEILERLFGEYLKSIRSKEALMDAEGHFLLNELGDYVYRYTYYEPPTQLNFCRFLGIDKNTWWTYCNPMMNPDLAEATKKIKTFFESYLENSALNGTANHNFVVFNLTNNYGWKDQKEVEFGKKTREAVQVNSLSPAEKLAIIKKAAESLPDDQV